MLTLCWLVELTHAWILSPCLAFPGPGEFLILQMFQLFAYVTCLQCCRAKPFFLGSSSRYFFGLRLHPLKLGSDWLLVQKTDFYIKHLKNLNFLFKIKSNTPRFCPKNGKKKLLLSLKKSSFILTVGRVNN